METFIIMEFKLIKYGIYYKPAFEDDYLLSKKVKQGMVIKAKTERQRNYKLHQKAFVCLSIGFENQTQCESLEHYKARVLIAIGHCDIIYLEDGSANFIPKSISYESVPDDYVFGIIYNKIVEKVAQMINVTNQELAEQVASHF